MPWPNSPTVLLLDSPPGDDVPEQDVLRSYAPHAEVLHAISLSAAERLSVLSRVDVILTWREPVNESLISRAERCRLILHYGPGAGPGVAHVDRAAARRHGIYVAGCPDFAADEWAECMWRMMAGAEVRRLLPLPFRRRLRVGLIGLGQVGRRLAERWKSEAGEIWAHDPFADDDAFDKAAARPADLEQICGICDLLMIQVPLTPGTREFLTGDLLDLLRTGSRVVCGCSPSVIRLRDLPLQLKRGRPSDLSVIAAMLTPGAEADLLGCQQRVSIYRVPPDLLHRINVSCRRRAAEIVLDMLRGGRPGHLLIDPPCPRHEMWLAGSPNA